MSRIMRVLVAATIATGMASAYTAYGDKLPHIEREATRLLVGCSATDGDTLRCGDERIRINGIDAPEMRGHCRPGRSCVKGDPIAARDSLRDWLGAGGVTITRLKEDRYGRTVAAVWSEHGDAACWQIERGHATYKAKWDEGQRTAKECEQ